MAISIERPQCYQAHRNITYLYNDVPSFMSLPVITKVADLPNYDVTVMGIPWEGPVTWGNSSGCEMATKTIRDASLRYGGFLPEYEYDLFDYITACDNGDVSVSWGDNARTHAEIHKRAKSIFESGSIPLIYGGDHSVTLPIIDALAETAPGRVGIVHLDAHMDNLESFGDEKFARCSPFARIYENSLIDPSKIVHLGIRGPRNTSEQMKKARDVGATIINGYDVKTKGVEHTISKALEVVKDGTDVVYVSVCSDILDIAFNPGGPADSNGLSTFELSRILYELAKSGINGFDFVEIYPPEDPKGVSSHVAAWMGIYVMSGIAANRRG